MYTCPCSTCRGKKVSRSTFYSHKITTNAKQGLPMAAAPQPAAAAIEPVDEVMGIMGNEQDHVLDSDYESGSMTAAGWGGASLMTAKRSRIVTQIVSHLHDPREAPPAPGTMSKEDYQHYSVLSFLKAVAMLAVMHPERTQKSFMDVSF